MCCEGHIRYNFNPDGHICSFLTEAVKHKEKQMTWYCSTLVPKKTILGRLCDGIAKSALTENIIEMINRCFTCNTQRHNQQVNFMLGKV